MHAPYFSILLCLMPDNFTRQDERAGAYNVANFVDWTVAVAHSTVKVQYTVDCIFEDMAV